ncbi:MAG: response regulator transcription factor [Deltaproteobacteria bacterium]|nr:response regulator transcription factor [Deltaproteobacteria bacterium]
MQPEAIRVIIVEDDIDLRESLETYLSMCGFLVAGVGTCRDFYRAPDSHSFDIAVLDVGLPDQSGIVLAEYLHSNTTMGIIMLTAKDSNEDKLKGYDAGADIYLTKPVESRMLASAITNLAGRLKPRTVNIAPKAVQAAWALNKTNWILQSPHGDVVTLTTLEVNFLSLLSSSPGVPVSRGDLLQKLYNRSDDYTGKALDVMIYRLRSKVAAAGAVPLPVKSIRSAGYSFAAPLDIR